MRKSADQTGKYDNHACYPDVDPEEGGCGSGSPPLENNKAIQSAFNVGTFPDRSMMTRF